MRHPHHRPSRQRNEPRRLLCKILEPKSRPGGTPVANVTRHASTFLTEK